MANKRIIVECHNSCARKNGIRCTFWGISHRELYREKHKENEAYEQFMEKEKCSFYRNKREVENENKILFRPRDYGSNAKAGGKYKGVLANLMMERSMSFRRHISYYINADIDKIMRRLS